MLLFGFTDVYNRNQNLQEKYGVLQDVLQESQIESRHRRDVTDDAKEAIKTLEAKIDALHRRCIISSFRWFSKHYN